MDTRSKSLLICFLAAIVIAVGFSCYRYIIARDYYLHIEIECDPAVDACYVAECDPAEDETCPENPDERVSYYKIIEKKAYAIPSCAQEHESECPAPSCDEGEKYCREILCDAAIDGEGACAYFAEE